MTANGVAEIMDEIIALREPAGVRKSVYIRDPFILTQKRLLPLAGDVLPIADYPELVENTYVGDEFNETAEGFYKTVDPAGAIRYVDGEYFVLPDVQGIFERFAGENSKYTMAGGAPYAGGATGEHIKDGTPEITGQLGIQGAAFYDNAGCFFIGGTSGSVAAGSGQVYNKHWITFNSANSSNPVRSAPEIRPASLSALPVITY
jgi:hypothetical protein